MPIGTCAGAHAPHLLDIAVGIGLRQPGRLLDHRRLHQAGQDRVARGCACSAYCDRDGPGEWLSAALRGVIGGIGDARSSGSTATERDVDDRAAALRSIIGITCFMVRKTLFRLTSKTRSHSSSRQLDRRRRLGDADIVVEDVDAAVGRACRPRPSPSTSAPSSTSASEAQRVAAFARDEADGLLGGGRD